MADSYYLPMDDRADSADSGASTPGRYRATGHTEGPWRPGDQHGGPPNALAAHLAACAVQASGRDDLVPLRLASDSVGPVPVGELAAGVEVVRAARRAALVQVTLSAGGRECLRSRIWFVHAGDTAQVATPDRAEPALPDAGGPMGIDFGYGRSLDWRWLHGAITERGPAAVWARPLVDLVPGERASGLALAALVADSGNGISAPLPWAGWTFANVDLDVHLARPVDGEWILLDAVTRIGPGGSGLARSTLSDVRGEVGGGMQTLVVGGVPTE